MFMETLISDKHKTLQLYKLYLLRNSHLLQLYTSASDCKDAGNVPGCHFVKAFSPLPSHSQ